MNVIEKVHPFVTVYASELLVTIPEFDDFMDRQVGHALHSISANPKEWPNYERPINCCKDVKDIADIQCRGLGPGECARDGYESRNAIYPQVTP